MPADSATWLKVKSPELSLVRLDQLVTKTNQAHRSHVGDFSGFWCYKVVKMLGEEDKGKSLFKSDAVSNGAKTLASEKHTKG